MFRKKSFIIFTIAAITISNTSFFIFPKVNASEITSSMKEPSISSVFKYSQLSEKEKKAYELIESGIQAHSDSIAIKNTEINEKSLKKVYELLMMSSPYLMVNPVPYITFSYNSFTGYITSVFPSYDYSLSEFQSRAEKTYNAAVQIISEMPDDLTEYGQILYIHNYLADTIEYDNTDPYSSAYSALVEKKASCSGYSKAFNYLCSMTGTESLIIQGVSSDTESNHVWNKVSLDGNWYNIDVTWDDPIIVGNQSAMNNIEYYNSVRYHFFFISDSEISKDHKIKESFFFVPDSPTGLPENKRNAFLLSGDSAADHCVNALDLMILKKYILTGEKLTGFSFLRNDLNKDNKINVLDLQIMINYLLS